MALILEIWKGEVLRVINYIKSTGWIERIMVLLILVICIEMAYDKINPKEGFEECVNSNVRGWWRNDVEANYELEKCKSKWGV